MSTPVFLLGAGFNADAAAQVAAGGASYGAQYPLVRDLWRICFEENLPLHAASIEQRFAFELARNNYEPIKRLCRTLEHADYFLAAYLSDPGTAPANSYAAFFDAFPCSRFITFNYDGLPEIFLHRRSRWMPDDGFGVPVIAEREKDAAPPIPSSTWVLHLHGSLYVYERADEYHTVQMPREVRIELQRLPEPCFHFDADRVGKVFWPIRRSQTLANKEVHHRIIAPVPDKATGLQAAFVQAAYDRAYDAISRADHVVVIGYSFTPYDRASYEPLIEAFGEKRVAVVAPEAQQVVRRLSRGWRSVVWHAIPLTFHQWVVRDFPTS